MRPKKGPHLILVEKSGKILKIRKNTPGKFGKVLGIWKNTETKSGKILNIRKSTSEI